MTTVSFHQVGAWMHAPVHTVRPHDSVDRARELCERHRVNQLPVVQDGRLVGIVSDRDLRDAFPSVVEESADPIAAHRLTAVLPVEEIMTSGVITVDEHDGIEGAAAIMRRERIGALPVLRNRSLVGILTRSDLLAALETLVRGDRVGATG
jgi:acetoin utilization protein AcuB